MIARRVRLSFWMFRFEFSVFGPTLGVLLILLSVLSDRLERLKPSSFEWTTLQGTFGWMPALLLATAWAVGVFLGVPVVAREVERGTARLSWTLGTSRWRWYVGTVAPLLIVVIVSSYAVGVTLDRYLAATVVSIDTTNAFDSFGYRGVLVAARAALVLACGVTMGAIVGRSLPAVLLSAVVATGAIGGAEWINQQVLNAETALTPIAQVGLGDLYLGSLFQLPDGSFAELAALGDSGPYDEGGNLRYPEYDRVVPGTRYRFVEAREAVGLGAVTVIIFWLGWMVVSRRRPE